MKSSEVRRTLQINRLTLIKYVKEDIIKEDIMANGRYNYDKDSEFVALLFNETIFK